MKIIIDIGHPGHVHLFKNFAWQMQDNGHKVFFTCRQKEFEIELLEAANFDYKCFGRHYSTTYGKLFGLIKFNIQMLIIALKFKPDLFLSHGSMYAAQISWLLKKTHISLEDTFNFEQIRLYKPFTQVILTSDYSHPNLGVKNINYRGYHELAYLHPKRFKASGKIREYLKLDLNERYVILRFVSWSASHDISHSGINNNNKRKAVEVFSKYARVFISSEVNLPEDLEKYKFPLLPDKMHDALACASLVFGESATMAAEAAILGIPAIYIDNTSRLYTQELEKKYGLIYNFSESEEDCMHAINKGVNILSEEKTEEFLKRKEIMLNDKIDVTGFLVWFIENYPESVKIMKESPDFQYKFK